MIPIENKNQLKIQTKFLGKHNSFCNKDTKFRIIQFKIIDTNIENVSIYQNKVFFIIKNESKIPIENKTDLKDRIWIFLPLYEILKNA